MGEVLSLGKLHAIVDSVSINQFYSDNGWGSATQDIRTENRLYQYFGDPSMEIRTQAPKSFGTISVELAGALVKAFAPKSAAGAAATLPKDGVPIGRSLVADDGSVKGIYDTRVRAGASVFGPAPRSGYSNSRRYRSKVRMWASSSRRIAMTMSCVAQSTPSVASMMRV